MIPAKDEYCFCPHCRRETRHSVVRERVLAPVLWCLSCFRMRVGETEDAVAAPEWPAVEAAAPGKDHRHLAG